jgi:hypothetical protein
LIRIIPQPSGALTAGEHHRATRHVGGLERPGHSGAAPRSLEGTRRLEDEWLENQDREIWFVTGAPSGKALIQAAAQVIDDLVDEARAYMHHS